MSEKQDDGGEAGRSEVQSDIVIVISFLICSRYKRAHATGSYGA